jgi:dolichyl-phosphate beta-glucosyltransferase
VSNGNSQPYLSIIIPAYNEEKRLPPALTRIADFLHSQPYRAEVLVVENGSTDRTSAVVEEFCAAHLRDEESFDVVLLHSAKGKGNAVKHGVMAACGEYLLVTDTDLAVPIEEAVRFLPPQLDPQRYAIAIASREIKGAVRHEEPAYRHFMGRVFNLLVRWMAVPGIHDTQCGFKCFSRAAAHLVFPLQRINGWGFDVELLAIAQHHGLGILEIPVHWYYGADSRVRPIHDTVTMVADLLQIRRNRRAGLYDPMPPRIDEMADEMVSGQADEVTAV